MHSLATLVCEWKERDVSTRDLFLLRKIIFSYLFCFQVLLQLASMYVKFCHLGLMLTLRS